MIKIQSNLEKSYQNYLSMSLHDAVDKNDDKLGLKKQATISTKKTNILSLFKQNLYKSLK